MHRKVLQLLAVTLVLSLLATVGLFTVLASVRAPALPLLPATGASPQAPGDTLRPTTAGGPSRLASSHAAAEWAGPTGRALVSEVTGRKFNLGQLTILGQALVRVGYDNRTAPTGFESALNGARFPTWGTAPAVLLVVITVLVTVLMARRGGPIAEGAIAAAARAPAGHPRHVAGQRRRQRARLIFRAMTLVDRPAEWERVRLVPT